jgi:GT2 family glycosyltransferase
VFAVCVSAKPVHPSEVFGGSSDGSAVMVRREFPQVNLLANQDNRGFAAANNQAIALAKGRYILLLNNDTIVLDRVIEKTVAYADKHRDTAVIGCRVLNPDGTLQNSCFYVFAPFSIGFCFLHILYRLFPRSRFFGREQMTWWSRIDSRDLDVVTGCFMLVRKEAIDQGGPMDERFFMYAEETDWCYRFKANGWKNRFTPDAEVIHVGGASAAKLGAQRAQVTNCSSYDICSSIAQTAGHRKARPVLPSTFPCQTGVLFLIDTYPYWPLTK